MEHSTQWDEPEREQQQQYRNEWIEWHTNTHIYVQQHYSREYSIQRDNWQTDQNRVKLG